MTGPLGGTRRAPTVVVAAERGATRIADRVVAKIAAQAAREVLGTLPPDAVPPHATVVVAPPAPGAAAAGPTPAGSARVHLHLELGYPTPIGARCNAVRWHVAERVSALTGMEVPEVTVQVERLHLVPAPGVVQGRTQ